MVDTRFSVSIQIMLTLAYHQDELMNSEFLASILKTNATFVRKLVARLVEFGLVESFRGKGGGVKLAKAPGAISLKDIYQAATDERPLIKVHNKPINKACTVSSCIQDILCEVVNGIEQSTENYLAQKSLSDLMKRVK